jgi:hypothetical protein
MSGIIGNSSDGLGGMAQPISPAKKPSGFLKGCLIGAGAIIILVLTVTVGAWLIFSQSVNLMATLTELSKGAYTDDLSPDHTPEQRLEFEKTYDASVREIKAAGWFAYIDRHKKSGDLLDLIDADNKIMPDESKLWIEEWNRESSPAAPENQKAD